MTSSQPDRSERPLLWLHSHFELPTGGTKFIFETVRRLNEHRPVEVLVESASPLWRQRYSEAGVPLHEMPGPTSSSLAYWGAFPFYLARDQRHVHQRAAAASAIVSSFFPMPYVAGRAARSHGLQHVSLCFEPFPFFHDPEVTALYPRSKRALLAFLARSYGWIDRSGVRGAHRLMTLNAATAVQVERVYGRTDAALTYAGVDVDTFHPYPEEELAGLRARFGTGPLVIHSTDYSPIKRTDLAVRAFAVAARTSPDARLVITSTREDAGAQRQLETMAEDLGVADRVVHAGFLPFADLPRLYSLAVALLQTGTAAGSGATTMSLPVKEALACGTPVVRSRATDEDVEDGVSGFLVDPNDVEATGRRLADLVGDPERARLMGDAGRRRVNELYSWDRVVRVVLEALRQPT